MGKPSEAVIGKPVRTGNNLLWQVLLTVAICLLGLMAYDQFRYQPIMTVDVEAIMQQKMDQLQKNSASVDKERVVQLSRQWAQQLATEVANLATHYNAVVLVRPAVVEGSMDMTQHIMLKLKGVQP